MEDNDATNLTDEERAATGPGLLHPMEQLAIDNGDVRESTENLKKREIKRAEERLALLEKVESLGREQIVLAREESRTWSAEDDPLCTEAVPFPHPAIVPELLPPYEPPYDWRREEGSAAEGITQEDLEETRSLSEKTAAQVEANPGDPGVDEAEKLLSVSEEGVELAEEALAKGEGIQEQIAAQEEQNEDLYAAWEREYDEELYDDIAC